MKKLIFSIICVAAITTGCSSQPVAITQLSLDDISSYKELPRQKISSSSLALFGIIPLRFTSREERARNAILKLTGADDLIDARISSAYYWTPIGPLVKFRLEATPIIIVKNNNAD